VGFPVGGLALLVAIVSHLALGASFEMSLLKILLHFTTLEAAADRYVSSHSPYIGGRQVAYLGAPKPLGTPFL
jgi:hypothetical protein